MGSRIKGVPSRLSAGIYIIGAIVSRRNEAGSSDMLCAGPLRVVGGAVPRGLLGIAVLSSEGGPRLPGGLRGWAVVAGSGGGSGCGVADGRAAR